MVSILVPIAYVLVLFVPLSLFSRYYRRSKLAAAEAPEPWFGPHVDRDIYISLLSMQPPVPDPLLTTALLRRAMADVERIRSIRESKMALQGLLQRGQIGDDLWTAVNAAEKELEAELQEVVGEANTFRPNWGQFIFAQAQEMVSHERIKETYSKIDEVKQDERAKTARAKELTSAPAVSIGRAIPVGHTVVPYKLPEPVPAPAIQLPQAHNHAHPHPPAAPGRLPNASQPEQIALAPAPASEQEQNEAPTANGTADSDEEESPSTTTTPSPSKAKKKVRRRTAAG